MIKVEKGRRSSVHWLHC